ncbi:hypothetical protein [Deinococcus pimensis]|uniref:hypothetical protein n=1 Tax=Deinococcus pimensis TaxID=309888 RepID=UPI000484884F|nr:hypothetical protein [Deinococcus pimensis]
MTSLNTNFHVIARELRRKGRTYAPPLGRPIAGPKWEHHCDPAHTLTRELRDRTEQLCLRCGHHTVHLLDGELISRGGGHGLLILRRRGVKKDIVLHDFPDYETYGDVQGRLGTGGFETVIRIEPHYNTDRLLIVRNRGRVTDLTDATLAPYLANFALASLVFWQDWRDQAFEAQDLSAPRYISSCLTPDGRTRVEGGAALSRSGRGLLPYLFTAEQQDDVKHPRLTLTVHDPEARLPRLRTPDAVSNTTSAAGNTQDHGLNGRH